MKFTTAFFLATAALTSATAIDMEAAAPAKQDHLRLQFSHDYDCKWRHHGKGPSHQNPSNKTLILNPDLPKCNSGDYKDISFKFDKKDEHGKCFSPKDLKFPKDQEDFHSFSYCLPKRLEKNGCRFYIHDDVHCEGDPMHIIDTKEKDGMKAGQCLNVYDGNDEINHLNVGGARSIRVECPAKSSVCDPQDLEEADQWVGEKL